MAKTSSWKVTVKSELDFEASSARRTEEIGIAQTTLSIVAEAY